MGAGEFVGQEEASGFHDNVNTEGTPSNVGRILFGEHLNLVAIDNEEVAFERHFVVELAVHRVVLEHVGEVVNVEKVVDTDNLDVVCEVFHGGAEHHTADAAETIDTEFESHYWILFCFIVKLLHPAFGGRMVR